jgi:threonine dehydrogenase-like Zn-dependent dehydrogenase
MTTIEGRSRAAVQTAPHQLNIQELPLPEIPADAGILRVLRAGICGADVPMYADSSKVPRILGHENVGIIHKLGELAAERWGVKEGDYVALEEYLPCGHCDFCRTGEYRACELTNHKGPDGLRYGSTKTTVWPGLWGGYSQFTYIHPRAVMHKVPEGVSPRMAAMALPLGNGFQWAYFDGGAGSGPAGPCVRRCGEGGRREDGHRNGPRAGRSASRSRQATRRGSRRRGRSRVAARPGQGDYRR